MSSLKVAVVEDEPLARERLVRLLESLGVTVLVELPDGPALLDWLRTKPAVDAIFLDIRMPGGNGLEVLAEIPDPPPVVFVTAYADHAVRAFETEAVDYILKPVYKDRLERTLARLTARLVPARTGSELKALATSAKDGGGTGLRFPVKAGDGHVFLELRKVSHFEVEDEVVFAYSQGKRFRSSWTALSEVEADFPEATLVRIQRNILLRPEAVLGVRSALGGRCKVKVASDAPEIEVSRSATPRLRELLRL